MKLINNLLFRGDCRAAFERYAEVLGGEVVAMVPFSAAPGGAPAPAGWDDRIAHAWLTVGEQAIMGCDAPPGQGDLPMGGFSVCVQADTSAEARRMFDALAEGGAVTMPFGPQPWSEGFGMLTDRWGVPWWMDTTAATQA